MKNSKLEKFKINELDSLDKANKFVGGGQGESDNGTLISCYEPTDEPGGDTAVERWPDEGGVVTRFVFKTLHP